MRNCDARIGVGCKALFCSQQRGYLQKTQRRRPPEPALVQTARVRQTFDKNYAASPPPSSRVVGATTAALSCNCHRIDTMVSPPTFTISAWFQPPITLQPLVFTASTGQSAASRASRLFMVLSSSCCVSCAALRGRWLPRRVACALVQGRGPGLTGWSRASLVLTRGRRTRWPCVADR